MKLHLDKQLFNEAIQASSELLGIIPPYIEKDYWITLALKQLAISGFSPNIVFKGGTSLSKGYKLINRFSEDIDLAITSNLALSGNEVKTLIRSIEKTMTKGLTETIIEEISSKGSRYRKSVYKYPSSYSEFSNQLVTEISAFNAYLPSKELLIQSLIGQFLIEKDMLTDISEQGLEPFRINVLDKRQTLIEKLVSLIRFSYDINVTQSLGSKIRHFYDLYYLAADPDCAAFAQSSEFINSFNNLLKSDKEIFDIPSGWKSKTINESPLLKDFDALWGQLKNIYQKELTALAYKEVPKEEDIARSFRLLISKLML